MTDSFLIILNGLPAMIGVTFVQVTFLNIFAIWIEYQIISRMIEVNKLMIRCIASNLISLAVGLIVFFGIPELMNGRIFTPDDYNMTGYDILTMYCGLTGLFIVNVLLEIPAYILSNKDYRGNAKKIIRAVFIANVVSNIPVFIIYSISI